MTYELAGFSQWTCTMCHRKSELVAFFVFVNDYDPKTHKRKKNPSHTPKPYCPTCVEQIKEEFKDKRWKKMADKRAFV